MLKAGSYFCASNMEDLSGLPADEVDLFRTVATGTVQEVRAAIDNYQIPDRDKQIYGHYTDRLVYVHKKKTKGNQELLHYAAMYNTEDVLQLLFTDFKFSFESRDTYEIHPLMYALKNGMYKLVNLAIEYKYILFQKDRYGNNIIHYCCGGGVDIPEFPGSRRKTTMRNKDDCLECVKYIVQQRNSLIKFDVYHVNINRISTLRCALDNKLYNVAAWMLSQSETISNMSKVLQHETAETLAEIGKYKINFVTCEKPLQYSTAIHLILERLLTNKTYFTLQEIKDKLTQYVKNYGLDVNSTDHNGMTVLHYLCYYQYKQEAYGFKEGLIKLFVDLGTDPEIKDIRGYTALMCAVEKGLVQLSDYTDPRVNNEVGIGKLLNARGRIQKTVPVGDQTVLGVTGQQAVKTVPVGDHPAQGVIGQQKLLTQAKTKSGRVGMSSLLPSLGGHEDCKRMETLNPVLNDVCTQLGVVFVDNDKNFKFMDGSVNEEYYSEDGEKLTKAGMKRLLKNLGLTANRVTRGGPATNI